jgi:hypothetical protein
MRALFGIAQLHSKMASVLQAARRCVGAASYHEAVSNGVLSGGVICNVPSPDARTVAELVTGARDALRANAATKLQFPERNELPPTPASRPALRSPSSRRPLWRAVPSFGTKDCRSAPSNSSRSKANRITSRRPESSSSNSDSPIFAQHTTVSPPIGADRALRRRSALRIGESELDQSMTTAREQTRRGPALTRAAAPHLAPDHQLGELLQPTGGIYQIELEPLETKDTSEKPPRLQVSAD